MKREILKPAVAVLLPVAMLTLAGCFTPPNANVQPKAPPGLIQSGILIESVKLDATVQAVDAQIRTLTLKLADGIVRTYTVKPQVKDFDQVKVGDKVKAWVTEELAVYVLKDGRLPDGTTAEALGINARVLQVDHSYRLVTLLYPDGGKETLKLGLDTRFKQMEPGDSVAIQPRELTKLKIK